MQKLSVGNGLFATVDDEDAAYVGCYNWTASKGCIRSKICGKDVHLGTLIGRRMRLFGKIDHKDRDYLNNCRVNLRVATTSQNGANRVANSGKMYKGVHLQHGKFVARIGVKGVRIHLGCFDDPITAAKAYDEAAKKHFGEFAATNL